MQRPFVAIDGLGVYLPAAVVTNHDFETRLETTDQWIVERTGIRERRWASADETVATMARAAAEQVERKNDRKHGDRRAALAHQRGTGMPYT